MNLTIAGVATALALAAFGCSSPSPTVSSQLSTRPNVPGTVFTIVFENEDGANILTLPFFSAFAAANGQATNYVSHTHPSLPNYMELTSGANNGVVNDNDPLYAVKVFGHDNIADQLDAAGIEWRAYMEGMGEPCRLSSGPLYSAHHDPFLYYASMRDDPARCKDRVVDYDEHFSEDLASGLAVLFPAMLGSLRAIAIRRRMRSRRRRRVAGKSTARPGAIDATAMMSSQCSRRNRLVVVAAR